MLRRCCAVVSRMGVQKFCGGALGGFRLGDKRLSVDFGIGYRVATNIQVGDPRRDSPIHQYTPSEGT